jgi:hypothetical protein
VSRDDASAPLLSPADVAQRLNVPLRSARRYMLRMKHVYVGRHLRVTPQALVAWQARNEQEAEAPAVTAPAPRRAPEWRPLATPAAPRPAPTDDDEPIHITQPGRRRRRPDG